MKINGTARDRRFDFNDKDEDKVEGGDNTLKRANEPITIHTISYLAHSLLATATAQSATTGETPHQLTTIPSINIDFMVSTTKGSFMGSSSFLVYI